MNQPDVIICIFNWHDFHKNMTFFLRLFVARVDDLIFIIDESRPVFDSIDSIMPMRIDD